MPALTREYRVGLMVALGWLAAVSAEVVFGTLPAWAFAVCIGCFAVVLFASLRIGHSSFGSRALGFCLFALMTLAAANLPHALEGLLGMTPLVRLVSWMLLVCSVLVAVLASITAANRSSGGLRERAIADVAAAAPEDQEPLAGLHVEDLIASKIAAESALALLGEIELRGANQSTLDELRAEMSTTLVALECEAERRRVAPLHETRGQ